MPALLASDPRWRKAPLGQMAGQGRRIPYLRPTMRPWPSALVAEIETDKATMEFEAVDEGVVGKILVAEGPRR